MTDEKNNNETAKPSDTTEVGFSYAGQSQMVADPESPRLALFGNLNRDPVFFDAMVKEPLPFREALAAIYSVVGSDYQLSVIQTKDNQPIAGMILEQSANALTIQTLTEAVTVQKKDIDSVTTTPQSLMPPGLHQALNDREVIELLKYLTSL